jgi:large repetitive protein
MVRRAGVRRRLRLLPGNRARRVALAAAVVAAVAVVAGLDSSYAAFTGTTKNPGSAFGVVSSFYAQAVKDDAPTGYWRLGEPAGSSVAADASGNNHPGTYILGPSLGAAGASRDGDTAQHTGDYRFGVLPNLLVNDYSVELWFKSSASSPTIATNWYDAPFLMLGNMPGSTGGDLGLGLNGDGRIMAGNGEIPTTIETPAGTAYNNGAWHHVVFTRVISTGALKLYVDGSLKQSGTGGSWTEDDSPVIGLGGNDYWAGNYHGYFNGSIDEVAEYTTALSGARISAHFSARNTGYAAAVTTDSPAGYWRLDDATGRAAATIGGAAATGGVGAGVLRSQPGATGDGDTAMTFPGSPPTAAYVPRLVSGSFTIEARFRTKQNNGGTTNFYNVNRIFGMEIGGVTDDFAVGIGADGRLYGGVGNPDTTAVSPAGTVYNDGVWHEVAMTRTGGTGVIKLYADGVQVGTGTGGTQALTASSTLGIGSDQANGVLNQKFDGVVSDAAQYTSVLTQTRLAAHVSAATSQAAYRAAVTADAPAGYWALDDTTGTALAATVGGAANNGYADTGVLRGVAAPTGAGLEFDLVNERGATVPRLVQDDFSLECWFTTTSGVGGPDWYDSAPLINGDVGGTAADFGLGLSKDGRVVFGSTNNGLLVKSGPGLNDGQWHHTVLTRAKASGALVLYVDGAQAGTGTGPTTSLNASSVLGLGYNRNRQESFEGTVDEVAMYSTVLTAAQVANHNAHGA